MARLLLALLLISVPGCAAAPGEEVGPPLAAPTPVAGGAPLVLRRCDDGGDGGVLIDGICL